jgi:hypothetical protein
MEKVWFISHVQLLTQKAIDDEWMFVMETMM